MPVAYICGGKLCLVHWDIHVKEVGDSCFDECAYVELDASIHHSSNEPNKPRLQKHCKYGSLASEHRVSPMLNSESFQHKMAPVQTTESATHAISESHIEIHYNRQFNRMMAVKSKTRKCEHGKKKLKDQYKAAK